jgi:hypothetical protein
MDHVPWPVVGGGDVVCYRQFVSFYRGEERYRATAELFLRNDFSGIRKYI